MDSTCIESRHSKRFAPRGAHIFTAWCSTAAVQSATYWSQATWCSALALGHLQSRGIDPAALLITERLCATPLSSDWAAQVLRVKVKLLKGWSKSTLSDFQVLRSVLTMIYQICWQRPPWFEITNIIYDVLFVLSHKTFVNEEKIRNHNKKRDPGRAKILLDCTKSFESKDSVSWWTEALSSLQIRQ